MVEKIREQYRPTLLSKLQTLNKIKVEIRSMPLSLAEMQEEQGSWTKGLLGEHCPPSNRMDKALEEAIELGELKGKLTPSQFDAKCQQDEGFRGAVGNEAMDVVMTALDLIDSLGLDANKLFVQKISLLYQKYNLDRMKELRQQGLNYQEAMTKLKSEWNERFTKDQNGQHVISSKR